MKNRTGITLIALVVTIVILVILAAISINALMGQNGILQQAQTAGMKTELAEIKSQIQMDLVAAEMQAHTRNENISEEQMKTILEKYGEVLYQEDGSIKGVKTQKRYEILLDEVIGGIVIDELPDNTVDTTAGTIVKTPAEWSSETARYISTQSGEQMVAGTKVSTVYAVAIGDGISVPVPYGFYYVGGNLQSGVVISDNEIDRNKYVDQEDVPSGFDLDQHNNPVYSIQGNQFVWIPCTEEDYHKTAFDTKFQNGNWDITVGRAEMTQIQKYGGFYVGRFEAGLASEIEEFTTTQTHTSSNQVYNKEGIPQLKPGKVAWNFVDWNYSKTNSQTMYNTQYVNSGLITGTQWDAMLQKITNSDPSKSLISSNWGNYYNQELTYVGRIAKAYMNESTWYHEKLGSYVKNVTKVATSSNNPCYVLSTGASEQTKAYNLYDVAGNLWEWTEESASYATTNQYRVIRGGGCDYALAAGPSCYRNSGSAVSRTSFDVGFRPVLYIK